MRVPVLLLIAGLSLAGCVKASSEVYPLVKTYSQNTQAQAADELEALPPGSAIAAMIADYAVLREQLRAAE